RSEAALRRRNLLHRNRSQYLYYLAICSPPRDMGSGVLLVRTVRQCFSRWTVLHVLVELGRASRHGREWRSALRCLDRKTRLTRGLAHPFQEVVGTEELSLAGGPSFAL